MQEKDLQVGDTIIAEYGHDYHKFIVAAKDEQRIHIQMKYLGIITKLENRDWYFVKRPVSIIKRLRQFFE